MAHDDQSMRVADNIVVKKGASASHLKSYDSPYKMHDYSNTEDDISADGIGWNIIDEPKTVHPVTSWAEGTDIWNQRPHETDNFGYGYHSLPNKVTKDKPIQPKENKIDWNTIGILAFIKLGLVKLQAIGFLKTLFLIMFKFKLYMTAVLFKFLLLMKLMKLFKIILLPLLILLLIPTLIQLFSLRSSNNNLSGTQTCNVLAGGSAGTTQPIGTTGTGQTSGTTGILRPITTTGTGQIGGTTGTVPTGGANGVLLPSVSTTTGTGRPVIGGTTRVIQPDELTGIGQTKRLSSYKFDDLNVIRKQHNDSSMLFDPTWEIFQKILDSEKCIERIACQISVAEKAGVMPFWINW